MEPLEYTDVWLYLSVQEVESWGLALGEGFAQATT